MGRAGGAGGRSRRVIRWRVYWCALARQEVHQALLARGSLGLGEFCVPPCILTRAAVSAHPAPGRAGNGSVGIFCLSSHAFAYSVFYFLGCGIRTRGAVASATVRLTARYAQSFSTEQM